MGNTIPNEYKVQIGKWKGYKCPECGALHDYPKHLELDLLEHEKPEEKKVEETKIIEMDKYKDWGC